MPKKKRTDVMDQAKAVLMKIIDAGRPMRIHRSKIKNAPYNPRTITDKARQKLEAGMRRHGMISLPTWNERTGNLVGGHQRVKLLDDIGHTEDYELDVVRVEMTDSREKEANLLLNNDGVTGDFDMEKLNSMLGDKSIELEGTGFDMGEVYRMFGDAPGRSQLEIDGLAEKLRDARKTFDDTAQKLMGSSGRESTDFYVVVVFRDEAERVGFTEKLGLPDNRYQDGRELLRLFAPAEKVKNSKE